MAGVVLIALFVWSGSGSAHDRSDCLRYLAADRQYQVAAGSERRHDDILGNCVPNPQTVLTSWAIRRQRAVKCDRLHTRRSKTPR